MTFDRSFAELNRASRERIRALTARLDGAQMRAKVGAHWTVSVALAHLAFWDRRVIYVLDMTERDGKVYTPQLDVALNDLLLPFWAAIPGSEAARLATETAEAVDNRLEQYAPDLLEQVYTTNRRWVIRALHRNEHLDEVDAALKQ